MNDRRTYAVILLLAVVAMFILVGVAPQQSTSASREITTDVNGDATLITRDIHGKIAYVFYAGGFDSTVDFAITCVRTGGSIWTETNVVGPKLVVPTVMMQDLQGRDQAPQMFEHVWCPRSPVSVVISQGGDTKTALFEAAYHLN